MNNPLARLIFSRLERRLKLCAAPKSHTRHKLKGCRPVPWLILAESSTGKPSGRGPLGAAAGFSGLDFERLGFDRLNPRD